MQSISFTKFMFDRSVRICTWIQSSMNFDVLPKANLYFAFVMVNKNKLHIQSEDPFKNLWLIKYKFWQIWIPSFFLCEKKRYKDECNIVKVNIYIIGPFLNNSVKYDFNKVGIISLFCLKNNAVLQALINELLGQCNSHIFLKILFG